MTKTYNAIVAVHILYQSAGCSTKTRASIRKIYGFVLILVTGTTSSLKEKRGLTHVFNGAISMKKELHLWL